MKHRRLKLQETVTVRELTCFINKIIVFEMGDRLEADARTTLGNQRHH